MPKNSMLSSFGHPEKMNWDTPACLYSQIAAATSAGEPTSAMAGAVKAHGASPQNRPEPIVLGAEIRFANRDRVAALDEAMLDPALRAALSQASDETMGGGDGLVVRGRRDHRHPQSDVDSLVEHAHRGLGDVFGGVGDSHPAVPPRQGQPFGGLRITRNIDFGMAAPLRDERRAQVSLLDPVVPPVEVDVLLAPPERVTNREELVGALVPPIVVEEVAIGALLLRRVAGNDVEREPAADQGGKRVELLHEGHGRHQAGTEGDDELDVARGQAQCGGEENRVRLGEPEVQEERLDPGGQRGGRTRPEQPDRAGSSRV